DGIVAIPGALQIIVCPQVTGRSGKDLGGANQPACHLRRAAAVCPVQQILSDSLAEPAAGIAVSPALSSALAMMRKILLVPVNADQIFQRAGNTRFLMAFQLREIDNQVGFDSVARHQVLVTSPAMRTL